ncbi:MAG: class I SAM-dependent RNA methyltransferase [Aeriscardovia sp.]|nr:class I SAM-dependent RNA methyltransferase [Aeriscardovia sp.]
MAPREFKAVIEKFADQGRCVTHIEGRAVFVRFALPGEEVLISIDEPARPQASFWTGEAREVLSASPFRVGPLWKEGGPRALGGGIGGADLCFVSLEGQILWKKWVIENQLRRIAGIEAQCPVERLQFDLEHGGLHWRSRIELATNFEGLPSMRRRGSHDLVPVSTMPLGALPLLKEAEKAGIWKGGLPKNSSVRMAVGSGKEEGNFYIGVGGKKLAGRKRLIQEIKLDRAYRYEVDAASFWQVHVLAAQTLAGCVYELAKPFSGKLAWDLYSGSGLFTLPLGSLFKRVESVEQAPKAVQAAKRNTGGDKKFVLSCAKAEKAIPALSPSPGLVVADPSRSGLGRQVCEGLAEKNVGALAYVSCNPTTFARDCGYLREKGYRLEFLRGFDLYPCTHHTEVVALLVR